MDLVTRERELYATAWTIPAYSEYAPGEEYVASFVEMAEGSPRPVKPRDTVLDAGAGTGKGAIALVKAGFKVELADLTRDGLIDDAQEFRFHQVCLWDDLSLRLGFRFGRKFDWVYCCDVLEHVPTPFVMLVVSRLLAIARHGVFLSIALREDNFGAFVGQPLHLTVQNFVAWREQLGALGDVVEARDLLHSGLYLVRPR